MSVPRRKPESTSTGTLAADRLEDLGQRVDGGAAAVVGAAAMVRHDDAVEADLDREPGVLRRHQAFHQQAGLHRVAQALDERPGEGGVAGAGDAGDVDPVEAGLALHEGLQAERMAGRAVARIGAHHPGEKH